MTTPSTRKGAAGGSAALLRAFHRHLATDGLRPSTIFHYVRDAKRFCQHLNGTALAEVGPDDVRGFLAVFHEGRAAKTVYETQLGLRRFFRWLVAEDRIREDPTDRIPLTAYCVTPQPTYTAPEVQGLLPHCSPQDHLGTRDWALVLVLWDTGVRLDELVSMRAVDWERRNVQVVGQNGTRNVPLGQAALQALDRYCRQWGINRGLGAGLNLDAGLKLDDALWWGERGPLTRSGAFQAVRRLCRRAGVEQKGIHAFRRGAAAQMKHLGMQDPNIMEIFGWRGPTMLRRYTAPTPQPVAEELAQEAHRECSPADHLK